MTCSLKNVCFEVFQTQPSRCIIEKVIIIVNSMHPPLSLSCGSKVIREIIAREEPGNEASMH